MCTDGQTKEVTTILLPIILSIDGLTSSSTTSSSFPQWKTDICLGTDIHHTSALPVGKFSDQNQQVVD